ncbi:MAG: OmpH family outer membrane protein [Desulfovibrio sp.]|jgi:Skp family chaperone for outer membrane proteins|nr:OmpH family outer membrane protein [Desulfovibrio sp.]
MRARQLYANPWVLTLLLLAALTMFGCRDEARKPQVIAIVDVERVMQESRAAKEGQAHLEAVTATFQKGWEDLQAAAEREPEDQRKRTLARGLATLQQQIRAEESAVRRMVRDSLVAEVRTYRQRHGEIAAVVSSDATLDADPGMDITQQILDAMFLREVTLPVLPEITVLPGTSAGDAVGETSPPEPVTKGSLRGAAQARSGKVAVSARGPRPAAR